MHFRYNNYIYTPIYTFKQITVFNVTVLEWNYTRVKYIAHHSYSFCVDELFIEILLRKNIPEKSGTSSLNKIS